VRVDVGRRLGLLALLGCERVGAWTAFLEMTLTLTPRLGDKLEAKSAVANDDADDRDGLYILFMTSDEIADSR
jgi:hypothetical protein